MPESTMTNKPGYSLTEFFGNVLSSVGEGVSRAAETVLPVWVEKELGMQQSDQLRMETYQQEYAPRKVDSVIESGRDQAGFSQVLLDVGSLQVTGSMLIIAGVLVIGSILVFKRI